MSRQIFRNSSGLLPLLGLSILLGLAGCSGTPEEGETPPEKVKADPAKAKAEARAKAKAEAEIKEEARKKAEAEAKAKALAAPPPDPAVVEFEKQIAKAVFFEAEAKKQLLSCDGILTQTHISLKIRRETTAARKSWADALSKRSAAVFTAKKAMRDYVIAGFKKPTTPSTGKPPASPSGTDLSKVLDAIRKLSGKLDRLQRGQAKIKGDLSLVTLKAEYAQLYIAAEDILELWRDAKKKDSKSEKTKKALEKWQTINKQLKAIKSKLAKLKATPPKPPTPTPTVKKKKKVKVPPKAPGVPPGPGEKAKKKKKEKEKEKEKKK